MVYTDQQLRDYPLRLSHIYCSTSGERKTDDNIVGGSVTDSFSVSLSVSLNTSACTHIHHMYITFPPMYSITYMLCSRVYTCVDWKLIGRCVGLTEADLTAGSC